MSHPFVAKIVSGGQTGADRVGLDVAIETGIPHGGWCPKGRLAEDGRIAECYHLTEATEPSYLQRTEWNARDSDATAVFSLARDLTGGSLATVKFARRHERPFIHLSERVYPAWRAGELLVEFVRKHDVKVLNVAGPRVSTEPDIERYVRATLEAAVQVASQEEPTGR